MVSKDIFKKFYLKNFSCYEKLQTYTIHLSTPNALHSVSLMYNTWSILLPFLPPPQMDYFEANLRYQSSIFTATFRGNNFIGFSYSPFLKEIHSNAFIFLLFPDVLV